MVTTRGWHRLRSRSLPEQLLASQTNKQSRDREKSLIVSSHKNTHKNAHWQFASSTSDRHTQDADTERQVIQQSTAEHDFLQSSAGRTHGDAWGAEVCCANDVDLLVHEFLAVASCSIAPQDVVAAVALSARVKRVRGMLCALRIVGAAADQMRIRNRF